MVSRKNLLTLLAVLVPASVFLLTAFSEPTTKNIAPSDDAAELDTVLTRIPVVIPTQIEQSPGAVVPVSLPVPGEESIPTSSTAIEAFTEPYRDISVAASEMGTLATINVLEGQVVTAGEIIAELDDHVLRASLEVARRSMNVQGALKSAKADLQMKISEREKLQQLRDRNHASQQEVARIETELQVAEARLLSVQEELEIKQLEARRIESQIEQRIIRAPLSGVISELLREPGEFVSPSDPAIARLVQLDPLMVVFSLPLAKRNELQKDQSVTLKVGDPGTTVQGVVEYVSPTADSSNSSVRVKVRLSNSQRQFQSGERTVLLLNSEFEPSSPPTIQESTPVARREP